MDSNRFDETTEFLQKTIRIADRFCDTRHPLHVFFHHSRPADREQVSHDNRIHRFIWKCSERISSDTWKDSLVGKSHRLVVSNHRISRAGWSREGFQSQDTWIHRNKWTSSGSESQHARLCRVEWQGTGSESEHARILSRYQERACSAVLLFLLPTLTRFAC